MPLIAPLEAVLPPIDILSGRVKWRRILRKAFRTRAKARFLLLRSAKSSLDLRKALPASLLTPKVF
ncbi:hypothetical protein CO666_06155 [Rhizobium chutanense]|uniref:Uncharacterized protein n=1 Tax=Rhizobium chutanense TaxID=2035448 RepID=A0A2A6JFP9_9HYPH|nr:hypothetical protein CO666_06155 [Rhizobium chutanense]